MYHDVLGDEGAFCNGIYAAVMGGELPYGWVSGLVPSASQISGPLPRLLASSTLSSALSKLGSVG